MDCVFCAIVAGTSPSSVVYGDDRVLAFMDIRPVVAGHLLVIPRRHAVGLADLDPQDGERVFRVGQRLAAAIRASSLPSAGINLFLADGVAAGQEVFHAHLHVLPRNPGDGFGLRLSWRHPPRAELDTNAAAIRDALG
ncbi:MAG TPA: HIT family protein [Pseudonocardiaceae bacterium]